MALNEDTLVQQTTADYLRDALGWRTVFAYNTEAFGPEGTLGRKSDKEVVLSRTLGEKLIELNPGLPPVAYQDALRQIVETTAGQTGMATNREKYLLLRDGVKVEYREPDGNMDACTLRVFDFDNPDNNDFLAVRELWIRGDLYRRRADIIGFVNGIPLLFVECKNVHKNLRAAYDQNLKDYQDVIPHLFQHNAFQLLANGTEAKIGAIGGKYEHFYNWKRLEEAEPGVVDMETSRDAVRLTIHDCLYADSTGLPVDAYDETDVETLSDEVYRHVWRAYPRLPSPVYCVDLKGA